MSSETMNAENMKSEMMNIDTAVISLYVDIHVYIIYNLIGMVRLALIFISAICVMLGYMCSVCSVWIDKLLIGISASINIARSINSINYNIRHMSDIVSGIINRNFASVDDVNEIYSNLFNNGIPININSTYIKTEPTSDDESDDDDDAANETSHADSEETSHDESDEYADLPDLIPINDINETVNETIAEPKIEPHVSDNKVYIDDDIQDVTDQYLAEKEANKVIVDLTQADDKNTSSDNDHKNTSESI